ncbi:MAG: hypothetical protein JWQ49_3765 [Edaphobacter sp.]|nr:hypothetical protein [Edaphobacter sp.]
MVDMSTVRAWAELVRDVGLIIGVPVLITIGVKLYGQQIEVLKSRNELLKETQYDRALDIIKSQRELFELERDSLEKKLRKLESEGSIALADKEREIDVLKARLGTVKETISNLESSASIVERAGFDWLFSGPMQSSEHRSS